MTNYTFIIPHKNIPDLLSRCVSSIPQRDDIQIIIVDDNSDADKVDFDIFPGMERKDTEIIFSKNIGKGAGYARNLALSKVKGKWVLFADADDLYTKDLLYLLDEHREDDADIVYFNLHCVFSDDLSESSKHAIRIAALKRYENNSFKISDYCRYYYTEPWGKMIKFSLIKSNQILFEESPIANDYYFSIQSGYYAKSIKYDNRQLYYYTQRRGSLSDKMIANKEMLNVRLSVYWHVQAFMDIHHIKYIPFFDFWCRTYKKWPTYRTELKKFCIINDISILTLLWRYAIGKLYQYSIGVH